MKTTKKTKATNLDAALVQGLTAAIIARLDKGEIVNLEDLADERGVSSKTIGVVVGEVKKQRPTATLDDTSTTIKIATPDASEDDLFGGVTVADPSGDEDDDASAADRFVREALADMRKTPGLSYNFWVSAQEQGFSRNEYDAMRARIEAEEERVEWDDSTGDELLIADGSPESDEPEGGHAVEEEEDEIPDEDAQDTPESAPAAPAPTSAPSAPPEAPQGPVPSGPDEVAADRLLGLITANPLHPSTAQKEGWGAGRVRELAAVLARRGITVSYHKARFYLGAGPEGATVIGADGSNPRKARKSPGEHTPTTSPATKAAEVVADAAGKLSRLLDEVSAWKGHNPDEDDALDVIRRRLRGASADLETARSYCKNILGPAWHPARPELVVNGRAAVKAKHRATYDLLTDDEASNLTVLVLTDKSARVRAGEAVVIIPRDHLEPR